MKIGQIMQPQFSKSFSALLDGGVKDINPKIALQLKRIEKKLRAEQKNFQELQEAIAKEYCDKNENNEPIVKDGIYIINPENTIIVNKKISEIMDTDMDIGIKINFDDIKKVNLSIKDLIVLEDIINDPVD